MTIFDNKECDCIAALCCSYLEQISKHDNFDRDDLVIIKIMVNLLIKIDKNLDNSTCESRTIWEILNKIVPKLEALTK